MIDDDKSVKSLHEGVIYSYDYCSHKSKRKSHLQQHVESLHEGVIYSCDYCEHKAKQKSNLKQHVQSVHNGVKFSCEHCDYFFLVIIQDYIYLIQEKNLTHVVKVRNPLFKLLA